MAHLEKQKMGDFSKRIKRDWENQPLAILTGIAGLVLIPISYFASNLATTSILAPTFKSLAIFILVNVVFALACRVFFSKSLVVLLCVSITFACASFALFSLWEKAALIKTSAVTPQAINGPLIDLTYWSVFLVFLAANADKGIGTIIDTWGSMKSAETMLGKKNEDGVTFLELLIVVALWGSFLSGGQQRVFDALVFERAPIANSKVVAD
jgi:hypothetical protein